MPRGTRIVVAVLAYVASLAAALFAMMKLLLIATSISSFTDVESWEWYARNGAYVLGLAAIAILLFRRVKKLIKKVD